MKNMEPAFSHCIWNQCKNPANFIS